MDTIEHGAPFEPSFTKTPETDRGFGDRRTVSARWETEQYPAADKYGDDKPANAVDLSISHHKGQGYTITATAWGVYDDGSTTMQPFRDITRIAVVPGARYSRKVLAQVAGEALAAFPGNLPAGSAAAEAWERVEAHHRARQDEEAAERALEAAAELLADHHGDADPVSANLPDFFEAAV